MAGYRLFFNESVWKDFNSIPIYSQKRFEIDSKAYRAVIRKILGLKSVRNRLEKIGTC
jgi:hypothetical protein